MTFWEFLKRLWNAPVYDFTAKVKRQVPTKLADDCYAVIKLSKFDNLEVAIMADDENDGIAISYEDAHLDSETKARVEAEIQSIISDEMNKVMGE